MRSLLWQLLFWSWTVAEILIGIVTRTRRGSGKIEDRGSLMILWIVLGASITACQWISSANLRTMFNGAPWLRTAALMTLILGLAIRWTAILTLGKAFSANVAIRESQTINKSGLFRYIRHPSYLGLLLVLVAIGMHSQNWIAFGCAVVPTTAALLYRIHVEERALSAAFGDEYALYSKHTKRLVPGVF